MEPESNKKRFGLTDKFECFFHISPLPDELPDTCARITMVVM